LRSITYKFEELPAYRDGEWVAGLLYGKAEIEFNRHGSWFVTAITLDGDNGKIGNEAKGKSLTVSQSFDTALWARIESELREHHESNIIEKIEAELADEGLTLPLANVEHRARVLELVR
jgi:hypothetical protein